MANPAVSWTLRIILIVLFLGALYVKRRRRRLIYIFILFCRASVVMGYIGSTHFHSNLTDVLSIVDNKVCYLPEK